MKFFLLATLTVTSLTVQAQKQFISIKSGANFSNVSAKDIINSDGKTSFLGGIGYERFLKGKTSISVDLLYNRRGYQHDFTITSNNGGTIGRSDVKSHFDYLSVPIAAVFNFGSRTYGFGKIGLIPSWLAKAKAVGPKIDDDGHITGSQTIGMTDFTQRFDLSGMIEAGGGYEIDENYRLFISIGYQHSFTSYTTSGAAFESRHRVLSLSLGLKYKLKE